MKGPHNGSPDSKSLIRTLKKLAEYETSIVFQRVRASREAAEYP